MILAPRTKKLGTCKDLRFVHRALLNKNYSNGYKKNVIVWRSRLFFWQKRVGKHKEKAKANLSGQFNPSHCNTKELFYSAKASIQREKQPTQEYFGKKNPVWCWNFWRFALIYNPKQESAPGPWASREQKLEAEGWEVFFAPGEDPRFWSGGPAEFWPQGGAWAQNLLKIEVFPWDCLKTAWFWRNLGGKGGRASLDPLLRPVLSPQKIVFNNLRFAAKKGKISTWKEDPNIFHVLALGGFTMAHIQAAFIGATMHVGPRPQNDQNTRHMLGIPFHRKKNLQLIQWELHTLVCLYLQR